MNRRAHNARNLTMVADALQQVGAARSIVIDESNVVLAGNGVREAAVHAGLTKLLVVDADGSTVVAVRRSGLTDEQKRLLAMYDNRAGELAEWNIEQLRQDSGSGLDLQPFFFPEELQQLVGLPTADEWSAAAEQLPAGGRSGFQHVTFFLSDAQVETVREAVAAAKSAGDFVDTGNENGNGNAIARICEGYVRQGSDSATD